MSDTIEDVLNQLGGGAVLSQLAEALREVGRKTAEHGGNGKEGKVDLTLKFVPTKECEQITIESTVFKQVPAADGHITRKRYNATHFFLDTNSDLTVICPEETPDGQKNLKMV